MGSEFHLPLAFPFVDNPEFWQISLPATCFRADFSLGLFFGPENGGDVFL
jgi:hypothetical protein